MSRIDSMYSEWEKEDGNQGRSMEDFLEYIGFPKSKPKLVETKKDEMTKKYSFLVGMLYGGLMEDPELRYDDIKVINIETPASEEIFNLEKYKDTLIDLWRKETNDYCTYFPVHVIGEARGKNVKFYQKDILINISAIVDLLNIKQDTYEDYRMGYTGGY